MLYFSGMTEDHELWSEWVRSLKKRGLDEPVAWLVKAGKPASILISQIMTMALPLITSNKQKYNLNLVIDLMEDSQQLDEFVRALQVEEEPS